MHRAVTALGDPACPGACLTPGAALRQAPFPASSVSICSEGWSDKRGRKSLWFLASEIAKAASPSKISGKDGGIPMGLASAQVLAPPLAARTASVGLSSSIEGG